MTSIKSSSLKVSIEGGLYRFSVDLNGVYSLTQLAVPQGPLLQAVGTLLDRWAFVRHEKLTSDITIQPRADAPNDKFVVEGTFTLKEE